MKTLSNFSKSVISKNEMKQISGGTIVRTTPGGKYCPNELSGDEREACMSGRQILNPWLVNSYQPHHKKSFKNMKTLLNFSKKTISKSEMKQVKGGGIPSYCYDSFFIELRTECNAV